MIRKKKGKLKPKPYFDVFLCDGKKKFLSKRYKAEHAATNRETWLKNQYGHLGYTTEITSTETYLSK